MTPDWSDGPVRVLVGDARERLREMADESVDALVTDPPAGIEFMGRSWDHDHGGKAGWVSAFSAIFGECLRVAKPGTLGFVWAIPRTAHWTADALEEAGWEIHPNGFGIHLFAQGFPKHPTHLKPAAEVWWLVRKPGPGGLRIDDCRLATGAGGGHAGEASAEGRYSDGAGDFAMLSGPRGGDARGRWPSNCVLSHAEGCVPMGTRRVRGTNVPGPGKPQPGYHGGGARASSIQAYADADGLETVEAWSCVEGCPVAELDRQSGTLTSGFMAAGTEREGLGYRGGLGTRVRNDTHGDSGGASRFFYTAKASPRERSAGLPPERRNTHPTVKPIALMRWLVRLVTPPDGTVLDPFMGSGTTGIAAVLEGRRFVGIEQDPGSVGDAMHRLRYWRHQPSLLEPAP